ncbi:MAG TPA: rhodanese-like domain-containing protein [Thermoanaerobaculia bacterium]|nr:rhodanese-like domain-containing protein [Thermoanaerobaculia bacterium]
MKSKLLLTALLLACAACAGERPPQQAAIEPAGAGAAPSAAGSTSPAVDDHGEVAATAPSLPAPSPERGERGPNAAAATPPAETRPEARRITPDELRPMLDRGEAVLVDVRGASDWAFRHASEALHIPSQDLFARSVELPHEKLIALYCT